MKCYFYNDGHGNGGYCSGMSCGPPSCNLSNRSIAEQRTMMSKTISKLKKIQDERI